MYRNFIYFIIFYILNKFKKKLKFYFILFLFLFLFLFFSSLALETHKCPTSHPPTQPPTHVPVSAAITSFPVVCIRQPLLQNDPADLQAPGATEKPGRGVKLHDERVRRGARPASLPEDVSNTDRQPGSRPTDVVKGRSLFVGGKGISLLTRLLYKLTDAVPALGSPEVLR
jgi:hypothetical protein